MDLISATLATASLLSPLPPCDTPPLDIVEIGETVLRKPARKLSENEILSSEIQNLIERMKITMRASEGVGLAAPQIGQPLQIVVIEDMDHRHLTSEQLIERNRNAVPFQVLINPQIIEQSSERKEFFEGCLSVPDLLGIVSRAESVRVKCLNELAMPMDFEARGWHARILQHEIDHLNGVLFIDKAIPATLMTTKNHTKFWKEKSIKEIQESLIFTKPTSETTPLNIAPMD